MAIPSYTHDLTDLILDSNTDPWGEFLNMTGGGAPDEADTESALQGTNTVSQATNTTALFSMGKVLISPVTLSAGYVFLVWHGHGVATATLGYASGGLQLVVATDLNNWKAWAVGGNDVPPFPYGKWINNPIDPTIAYEYSAGTPPTTNYYAVGSAGILSANVAKGQPHVVDIIRYGRAEARINGGETSNYATFAGFATLNDAQTARWGLIQATTGGYLWKGLMTLGYTSAVDFRDSNKSIFVQDTRKVAAGFNKIEIRQATSRVDWTGISITCLSPSTTASKGSFEVIDDADVNYDNCLFTDLDTFIFKTASTILNTTFRRCGLVTQGSGVFTGCRFENSPASASILSNNPAVITNSTFISDGSNHALELTTACAGNTYSLSGCSFTGYATSNGSTGNEVIYNNSGGAVIINASGCSGTISYRNGAGALTTVNNTITLTLTGLITGSDIVILDAGTTTERVNVDNNIPTTYAYGYTDSGSYVDIGVFKAGYIPKYVRNFLLATTNASLPIEQILDRNYLE